MSYISLGNPLWSCQFQIQGGVRHLLSTVVVYALILAGATALFRRGHPDLPTAVFATNALRFLSFMQIAVLMLGGSMGVIRAMARDQTTKMIESHRRSPMSAATVVIGYAIGGNFLSLAVFLVGVVYGMGFCKVAVSSESSWILGNAYLVIVAASIWCAIVFFELKSTKKSSGRAVLLLLVLTGPGVFVPVLGLVSGLYAVAWCYFLMNNMPVNSAGVGLTILLALLTLLFWSSMAARRYRKPHLPLMGVGAAFVVVFVWLGIVGLALSYFKAIIPFRRGLASRDLMFLSTLLSPLIVMHLPMAMALQIRRHVLLGASYYRRGEKWPASVAALVSLVIVLLGLGAAMITTRDAGLADEWGVAGRPSSIWLITACAYALALLTVFGLAKTAHFATGKMSYAAPIVLLLWIGPCVLDLLRVLLELEGDFAGEYLGRLFGCSPVGTIIGAWLALPIRAVQGLAVQLGIAVLANLLGLRAESVLAKRRARLLASEAA